jgi:hypothetical protein
MPAVEAVGVEALPDRGRTATPLSTVGDINTEFGKGVAASMSKNSLRPQPKYDN